MFNGNVTSTASTNYWLSEQSLTTNTASLTITFPEEVNLAKVAVCATSCYANNSRAGGNNRQTNYGVEVFRPSGAWETVSEMVDTANDAAARVREHQVRMKRVKKVRVNLQRMETNYFSMKEIDFYLLKE